MLNIGIMQGGTYSQTKVPTFETSTALEAKAVFPEEVRVGMARV